MAHFANDRQERISGQTIPLRIHGHRTILVWGGVVNGAPLHVFASDPRALRVVENPPSRDANPQYRSFTVTAIRDVDNIHVHVGPAQNAASAWDTITFIVNTAEQQAEHNRNQLLQLAISLVGSHYVEGAAGAMPDQLNGMPGRPGMVHLLQTTGGHLRDPRDIQSSVAYCNAKAFHTCAGRPWRWGVRDVPPFAQDSSRLDMSGESRTHSYRTVYMKGRRPTVERLGIILGERCEGIRHFDCVGFISYCLSATLGYGHHKEISAMVNSYANDFPKIEPTDPNPDLPGDILIFGGNEVPGVDRQGRPKMFLINAHHIGFSVGNGGQMIHAADTQWGVVRSQIGRDLTRRVRHPRLA